MFRFLLPHFACAFGWGKKESDVAGAVASDMCKAMGEAMVAQPVWKFGNVTQGWNTGEPTGKLAPPASETVLGFGYGDGYCFVYRCNICFLG